MMKLTLVLRNKKNQLKLSTRTLEAFVERIKSDTKDGAVARRRRQISLAGSTDSYDRQTPSHLIYPSAEFEKDGNENLRMRHFNGVIALTVDHLLHPQDLEVVKQAAQILHYTQAAFVGPSGQEVIILVRIAAPDAEPTEEEASELCRQGHLLASALYGSILPAPIRQEQASVRSCFRMPLDPVPYLNAKAITLTVSPKPLGIQMRDNATAASGETTAGSPEAAVADADISRETRQLMDFLNAHYKFRYNTMMGYTEYKDKQYSYVDWQPVDDRALKGMTMKVRLGGIDARDHDVRRYVQSDMIRPYDPIGDYLWEQYGKWDGNDHIRKLARTVPTDNPYWEDWFYTWFLGMVHQWQVTNLAKYGNQTVPLLISTQGWNKTTFCEQLLPPELSWGYTANQVMTEKQQVLRLMAQMLLINIDEFNQVSPTIQQGFLKNIITLSSVKIKRPYGRHVEDFPRRASFIATTNQPDVLADPSGSRRFLGVKLTAPIDISTPPNHEQLYAQAMQALHRHEPYYFGPEQTQQIMESNRQFIERPAAEQFFLDYFEPADNEQEGSWMSATAIFEHLKRQVGIALLKPTNAAAFGRRLSNLSGLQKRETSRNSEYLVKPKRA